MSGLGWDETSSLFCYDRKLEDEGNMTQISMMSAKRPTKRGSNGRYWVDNRRSCESTDGVYDDYNECVFPHIHTATQSTLHAKFGAPTHSNDCPLPPYLGPRDGSRKVLQYPCDYSADSIPDDIKNVHDDDGGASDFSSLSGYSNEEGSMPFTPPSRNEFMPFLNHGNIHIRDAHYTYPRYPSAQRRVNDFMPFLNYPLASDSDETSRRHISNRRLSIQLQQNSEDDLSYFTNEMTESTCSSTNVGSDPPEFKTTLLPLDDGHDDEDRKDMEDIGCIFDSKFLRDFMHKVFGRKKELPVFEVPSSYGYPPDMDDSSYSSCSVGSFTTRWPR